MLTSTRGYLVLRKLFKIFFLSSFTAVLVNMYSLWCLIKCVFPMSIDHKVIKLYVYCQSWILWSYDGVTTVYISCSEEHFNQVGRWESSSCGLSFSFALCSPHKVCFLFWFNLHQSDYIVWQCFLDSMGVDDFNPRKPTGLNVAAVF